MLRGRSRRRVLDIAALILLAGAAEARADDDYRLAIGVTDVAGGAAVLAGAYLGDELPPPVVAALLFGGGAVALAGGPSFHAAHDHWGRAGVSFASRVLLPLGGLVVGAKYGARGNRVSAAIAFGIAGYVLATGIDIWMASGDDEGASAPRLFGFGGSF